MNPLLFLALGAGASWVIAKKKKTQPRKKPKSLPPKVAATHKAVMQKEFRPSVLKRVAKMFGAEGYPTLAKEVSDKSKQIKAQARVVPELVERARAGDQNAMAMITACRENASHGLKRAQVTCSLIEQYCKQNPVQPKPGDEVFEESAVVAEEQSAAQAQ